MADDDNAVSGDTVNKKSHVKLHAEGEDEAAEAETGTKRTRRFQMPDVPRWWQAKIIQYAFGHPHVRARLEKHMGTSVVPLTDKPYMSELEERIRAVVEENLNKRIAQRALDEMERLKRLILVGKTPLKECPPELYKHPVFVFWRMVNREVAKESKKRADAFYKKLKAKRRPEKTVNEEVEEESAVGEEEQLTNEELFRRCQELIDEENAENTEKGFRFTADEYASKRFETPEVKNLKQLTTVEELYVLADKIIGTKRL